ncbi:MAG TPA: efflux RND transporter permease subunit [Gammaproteobacteria bacterium]|nr:efflux RND transporter permease subunit [Gammaproteobacteria bacterium]
MLQLVTWCVERRGVVAILAAAFLVLGVWQSREIPLDVFPEFVPAQVSIQTEAPGFTPDQVETLVTRPIEAAVNGAQGLAALRSESIPGLSVVSLDFGDDADPHRAHQDVAERLASIAASLPEGTDAPKLSPLTSSTMDVLKIGLVSDRLDAFALRNLADWSLKPQLLAVPGVARVNVFGGAVRQIQIVPDAAKLEAYGLTMTDLADAARAALALRGAGFVDLRAQRVLIESPVPAPDPAAIAAAVVAVRNGVPLVLRDVATVQAAAALRAGDATVQGRDGVLLTISSQFGANTMDVTRALEDALADIVPRLDADGITTYPALHRPATFIERALTNLRDGIAIAALLVLVVLFAFLRNVRAALISFVTIPVSLVAATLALKYAGYTLNAMTLGGLAVAVGVLVDDAIIDIENVMRRLRENEVAVRPRPRLAVVRDASLEIRSPVLYATLAVVALFVPVCFVSGVQGKFVGPLAVAFITAVVASLVTALTVTPALCALLLPARHVVEPRWIGALKRAQGRAAGWISDRLAIVAAVLVAAFAAALLWLPSLGGEFMPEFEEGHFVVQASSSLPGTSFDEMLGIGRRVSADILALPYIATVEQQVGRAELGEDTWGPNRSELHVELKAEPGIDQSAAQEAIREIVDSYPGLRTEVVTFLGDRFSESLTGETAAVVVNVFGDDLDVLDRLGARIAAALGGVPGVVDLQYERQGATPEIAVRPRPADLAAFGVSRRDLLDVLQTAFAGLRVGQTFAGGSTVDVVVIIGDAERNRIDAIGALAVQTPFGPVRVAQLADVKPAVGRSQVRHLDGQRRVSVTFNVQGRDLQGAVADARARIAGLGALPPNVFVRFAGEAEAERQARIEIVLFAAFALIGVVVILFLCFKRRAYPWLVLANLPFSLIGGIAAIGVTGIGLTLGALVGLVTVFGVSARNSILLLAHYEHLVDVEGQPWNRATALRGASERLVPILMTALVTALGLAPLALGLGRAGYEIEAPMAIAVLGGLITSTLLNLLVLLALAERVTGAENPKNDGLRAEATHR